MKLDNSIESNAAYCKAYRLRQCREFDGWVEDISQARFDSVIQSPRQLDDDSIVYLHSNHYVTDEIYHNRNILYSVVSKEWINFCEHQLNFYIPIDI